MYFYQPRRDSDDFYASLEKKNDRAAPLVIRAFPGETPILDGSRTRPSAGPRDFGGGVDCFALKGGTGYILEGLTIQNVTRIGFSAWGHGGSDIEIRKCTFRWSYRGAIMLATSSGGHNRQSVYSRRISITDCDFYENARCNQSFAFGHSGGWPSACDLSGDDNRIVGSRIFRNWGEGLGVYGKRIKVENCRLWDNYSVDIYVNNVVGALVSGNLVSTTDCEDFYRDLGGSRAAAVGIQLANEVATDLLTEDNVIVNNIVNGKRRTAFYWWPNRSGVGMKNVTIAHNTLINDLEQGAVLVIEGGAPHSNTIFRNNVFLHSSGHTQDSNGLLPQDALGTAVGLTFSHNAWLGGRFEKLPEAAKSIHDVYGGIADIPSNLKAIRGVVPDDFGPAPDARIIDAGVTVPDCAPLDRDATGRVRPQGLGPDLGAVEFLTSPER